jgi:hypothetical protein
VPPVARLTAALAAGAALSALAAAPTDAHAQRSRDRCRYYENGRSYPCEVRRAPARAQPRPFGYESRRAVTLGVGVLQYDLAGARPSRWPRCAATGGCRGSGAASWAWRTASATCRPRPA